MPVALIALLSVTMALAAANSDETRPLADAIDEFNAMAATDPIGKSQSPLTKQEVIAAIRFWQPPADAPVSGETLATFRSIAATGELPAHASLEKLTGYDPGGRYLFDVWSVRLRIKRPDDSTYAFILRERLVSSRTLREELARLEKIVEESPDAVRNIGWHRIENQIANIKKRIEENRAD